mmetsp:Transcript_104722/g.182014  ORF Transcript_104722/g.182014 Transcript_104722/m.182014 type:complete len:470 (-) Transcript_104722:34-1443(-)
MQPRTALLWSSSVWNMLFSQMMIGPHFGLAVLHGLFAWQILVFPASAGATPVASQLDATGQQSRLRGRDKERKASLLPHYEENGTAWSHDLMASALSSLSSNLAAFHSNATLASSQFSQSSTKSDTHGEPRLFFLFLTMSGVKRPELWRAFFSLESAHRYRIFIHCKHKHICELELSSSNLLGATQVETVPSAYCKDLVSPMVQLMHAALLESKNPRDKFIFLSETTLPVKPFWDVYNTLTWDQSSDFCIYPTDHWVNLDLAQSLRAVIVKHSQWVILNQAHANSMVHAWTSVKSMLQQTAWSIPVWSDTRRAPWGQITNPAGQLPLPMCLDEWAFFATIYGAFIDKGDWSKDNLPGYSAPPLHFRGAAHLASTTQGICRTFAFWDVSEVGASNLINEVAQDWPWSKLSCYPRCTTSHPAEFTALSDRGVAALRRSRFLFARKFQDQVVTMDQFQRIILAASVPAQVIN